MHDDDDGYAHKKTIKKESMYINQSLSFLEQCIVALGAREQRHIPYRQTKLTNVLKDSLGGNCNTLMFACISVRYIDIYIYMKQWVQTQVYRQRMLTESHRYGHSTNDRVLSKKDFH